MNTESDPNMPEKCPQCGATLPVGALGGLCPACLLKEGAEAETATQSETEKFQPPGLEEVAKLFPRLEILAFIGKGGMGAVYQARQPALDRLVALKILPPQVASGPGFAERFNREARALAWLNHPNIVAVHEFGQVNGLPFFIMEFVAGPNLRQLERAGKLSPREALQIVPQICEALQFAHDEGIVHRDIKPENILLDKKGRVKIADFGIAKIMGREGEADLTETKGAIGTPHYMAPEQVEKPQEVDHRADIFALGVVFYEMLTGELPLGKFAPPSRKVRVDVRLDDVVLRALEKEPELRYQQASQVKTAVETIAGGGAAGAGGFVPPPLPVNTEALVQEVLAREYTLNIRSCLRRGWALVRSHFWPIVGISALIWVLLAVAHSAGIVITSNHDRTNGGGSLLGLLVSGPLMGGLYFYFLNRIRGQPVTVETAFAGFSNRFLHLFLGSFVSFLLTVLGFFCLVLPGIYLWVAWTFTLPLIVDRRLDFWSAMELSRKMVTRHWWKLFGFVLVLALLHLAGFLAFCLGIFIAAPIAMASLMYAYEDIFGAAGRMAEQPAASLGPHGTAVLGGSAAQASRSGGHWKPAVAIGIGAALVFMLMATFVFAIRMPRLRAHERAAAARQAAEAERAAAARRLSFGPVIEQVIQARATGTNQFLDLDTGKLLTPSAEITSLLAASGPGENEDRFWQGLDIPSGSQRFQYIAWLRESGADLLFAGEGKLIGFDGFFAVPPGDNTANLDWDNLRPQQVRDAIEGSQRATKVSNHGDGPIVNLLTREQSDIWFFKTRDGSQGVLQMVGFTEEPAAVKIRYKLVGSAVNDSAEVSEALAARLDAATMISNQTEKDKALSQVAKDAAKAGEINLVYSAVDQIGASSTRDQTSLDSVRLLTKRGLRKEAIQIAQRISSNMMRDLALSELAR
jgi:predicted Ser/Thr protein kinase